MADLVSDLSTLARAERGNLKLEVKTFEPTKLLSQLHESYLQEAKSKKLKFNLKMDSKVTKINNSELYVREILQNFITNAIKYTPKGSVTISVQKAAQHKVLFSIRDTGIGIAEDDKKKIFSKFYRSENYQTRQTRGTGLGLYITLKLAEKIKGKIHFESELNHGSTFYLLVPSLKKKLAGDN